MRILSIRYRPVEGGTLAGLFALHVSLGAESDSEAFVLSDTDLARKIHDAYESLALKTKSIKGVVFDCRNGDIDSNEMSSLLQTLKDWKMFVVLWVNGDKRYAWFAFANHIAVFLEKPFWPNFKVNEIRYLLRDDSAEPEIYDVNANATCYVVTQDNAKIISFVAEAKAAWGIVVPLKSYPAVDFTLE